MASELHLGDSNWKFFQVGYPVDTPRDIWRPSQETSGAAGVGAEHCSVHSIHPKCKLQPVHTDTDKTVTMLLLFCPWPHQLHQMVISVPLWIVSTRRHPTVYQAFCNGGCVVQKTCRPFSARANDQAHKLCNAIVKGNGGAVGLCFETVGDYWATDCLFPQKLWA